MFIQKIVERVTRARKNASNGNDFINKLIDSKNYPLPYRVQIETISFCNGECKFCPFNRHVDPRGKNFMSEDVFNKIVSDLKDVNYSGIISMHGNTEPLLNKKIVEYVGRVRKSLPNAFIALWTNGTALDWQAHEGLFVNGLNHMNINNYSDENVWLKSVADFLEEFKKSKWSTDNRVTVHAGISPITMVLGNQGGIAPNKLAGDDFKTLEGHVCHTPLCEMQFNWRGDSYSCTWDGYYSEVLGNVKNASVKEIWYSEKYREYRRAIAVVGQRKKYAACAKCDFHDSTPQELWCKRTSSGDLVFAKPGHFRQGPLEDIYEDGIRPLTEKELGAEID